METRQEKPETFAVAPDPVFGKVSLPGGKRRDILKGGAESIYRIWCISSDDPDGIWVYPDSGIGGVRVPIGEALDFFGRDIYVTSNKPAVAWYQFIR